MTLAAILKDEGKIEGRVESLMELYADGLLSAPQTRNRLNYLLATTTTAKAFIESALNSIRD